MSLIQDALKRQQEESESSRVPLKTTPVRLPAMLGVALPARNAAHSVVDGRAGNAGTVATAGGRAGPEKPMQPGKSWKLIAGIIIFCILIVWGGGLLVVLILKQSAERTLLGSFMPNLIKSQTTLGRSSVQAPTSATQPPSTAMSKPMLAPSPARASASSPLLSPAAAAAPAFADEGEDVEEDMALPSMKEQGAPVAVPETAIWPQRKLAAIFSNVGSDQDGARLKPVVVWPRLKLSAIFRNVGSGQSGARLNNRLILLGDQIDGVTLVEIRRDSVVLKYGKETRLLKMGLTLN